MVAKQIRHGGRDLMAYFNTRIQTWHLMDMGVTSLKFQVDLCVSMLNFSILHSHKA